MEEIIKLQTLINNGTNITENYNKLENLIGKEYYKIKKIKEKLKIDIVDEEKCEIDDIENIVNTFLNKNNFEENSYSEYLSILKNLNFLINQTEKEKVNFKKLNYKSGKVKIEKLI